MDTLQSLVSSLLFLFLLLGLAACNGRASAWPRIQQEGVLRVGLDPTFGIFHVTREQATPLAYDLMEPFRPCVAEALTLRLFSHRVLRAEHFEKVKNNGIYLNKEGRRQLLQHYEKTLNREHYSEFAQCRTSLRRQIENTVLHYKTALADPERFAPFRMN